MSIPQERRWEGRRGGGRSVEDEARTSYYGLPAIHKAHWQWEIIAYFFVGGIAGASYLIATIAHLVGGAEGRHIARIGRYISLATLIPSPLLLIMDLKRPDRFHHMLRVVKLRSPMSVGTWLMTIFSGFCLLSALLQAAEDGLLGRRSLVRLLALALPSRPIAMMGSLFASFFGGYTGVLLAATAVPLWAKNYLLMGPLFLASAVSNATAAITLVLSLLRGTNKTTLKRLERLDMVALMAELGLLMAAHANLGKVIGAPLKEGRLGQIYRWGVLGAGIGVPLAIQAKSLLLGGKAPRLETGLASTLVLIGGLLYRYVIVMAGQASADDPRATYEFARADGRSPAQGDR